MKLDQEVRGQDSVITLDGMVTAGEGCDRLAAALSSAETERAGTIVVDVTEVRHLDSTGLGILVGAARRLHGTSREVRLVGVGPRIRLLLELTKLDAMFPAHATVADALAAERARPSSPTPRGGVALGDRNRHDL